MIPLSLIPTTEIAAKSAPARLLIAGSRTIALKGTSSSETGSIMMCSGLNCCLLVENAKDDSVPLRVRSHCVEKGFGPKQRPKGNNSRILVQLVHCRHHVPIKPLLPLLSLVSCRNAFFIFNIIYNDSIWAHAVNVEASNLRAPPSGTHTDPSCCLNKPL